MSAEPETCPRCGNWDPSIPRERLPKGATYCTPITCDAWTFTARLTKEGRKPLRPDERADLRALPIPEPDGDVTYTVGHERDGTPS